MLRSKNGTRLHVRFSSAPDPALTKTASPPFATDRDRLTWAVTHLRALRPELSAAEPLWPWQRFLLALLAPGLALCLWALGPRAAVSLFMAALMVPFFCVALLRLASIYHITRPIGPSRQASNTACAAPSPETMTKTLDAPLPRYTVLVPLYREAEVIDDLLSALTAIDYPRSSLEILLILEASDTETRDALDRARAAWPQTARVIVVPVGSPQTKPRALSFALTYATGDFVVVYDAEDIPDPDQLRRAEAAFAADPQLACVQARLTILNAGETWLTGQFAIEYAALFDVILPTLEALHIPIPLGGTSNHFRKTALGASGAWDPFNVTEDADLGIRLAREGKTVRMLASKTREEAPPSLSVWFGQRVRWIKGWIQTYLVHMRRPRVAARDLGWTRFLGLQILLISQVMSPFVTPWVLVFLPLQWGYYLSGGETSSIAKALFWLGSANLILGYGSVIVVGYMAAARQGRHRLARWALTMPLYWLLITAAAYRALQELVTAPFHWEKTRHRSRASFSPTPLEKL